MEILTLEIGNSSWWKDKKYRKEAVRRLRELRSKKLLIKLIKKYRLDTSNTIVYGDYLIKK
jgi:hypothetical protein|tara:strand:+ start:102 stop:284 length:183 start_codon:yes stop_codon:yes gene_type:complete